MNRTKLLAMAAAVTISGAASAQPAPPPGPLMNPYSDATITKADLAKAAEAQFAKLDANHDGSLSADEVAAAPGRGRGMRRADADGDGKITQTEYAAAQARRFDMMDGNHDGQLTKAERDGFREQMMARMRERGGPGAFAPDAPNGE